MPSFGEVSQKELKTCHADLQAVMNEAIKHFDFSVLEGHRNQRDQDIAYAKGNSKVRWPNGNHNKSPSNAVDVAPYPIDWANTEAARQRFVYLAGYIMMSAKILNIPLRWGGDWDGDKDTRDETFRDLGHFELLKK